MPNFMVPTFAIVTAENADEAYRIVAHNKANPVYASFIDEWLNPKAFENMEIHSILDLYPVSDKVADVLSEARTRIDEAFQDLAEQDDTEAWRESARECLDHIDDILTPYAEAA